jgi:hypothetical protein
MTTSAQVRTAWSTYIWQSATVAAITPIFFDYDAILSSVLEPADLYYDDGSGQIPAVNYFQTITQRQNEIDQIQGYQQTFQVRMSYTLQQTDIAYSSYNTVIDNLETVDDLVKSALGGRWQFTVNYYTGGIPSPIKSVVVDQKQCWRGEMLYTAYMNAPG